MMVNELIRKNKMSAKEIFFSRSQVTQENLVLNDATIANVKATNRAKNNETDRNTSKKGLRKLLKHP